MKFAVHAVGAVKLLINPQKSVKSTKFAMDFSVDESGKAV
jgi:hypothetical protein